MFGASTRPWRPTVNWMMEHLRRAPSRTHRLQKGLFQSLAVVWNFCGDTHAWLTSFFCH
jgi:hypothetical protein